MAEQIKSRNQTVDIIRGIAMLLVVLGHTMTGCTTGAEESFLYNIVFSLQMPLFILISGYVTKYSRSIKDASGLWKYVKKRTVAYMLPWLIWSLLVRGVILGQHNFLNIKYLLWHMDTGYWFLATIWTISMIFGLSTYFAGKISKGKEIKNKTLTLLFYVVGMAVLAAVGFVFGFSFFAIKLTLYYMPFYFAGYLYGQYRERILNTKWGKQTVDAAVAACFAVWLAIMTRCYIYALSDSVMAVALRIISSMTGCIAVCGLCKGLFSNAPPKKISWEGTASLVRSTLAGDLPRSLSAVESTETGQCTFDGKHNRRGADITELHGHGSDDGFDNKNCRHKQNTENDALWKQKIGKVLLWSGKRSLEIYLLHGLVLNVLMPATKPMFPSISGYCIVMANFLITLVLCAVLIGLLTQSNLRKLPGMR